MKALTLIQPWAWAICHAGKRIENRDWRPPRALWGQRIAIHAGKSLDDDACVRLFAEGYGIPAAHVHGAVVATARILGIVTADGNGDLSVESHLEDPPAWVLSEKNRVWFCGEVGWVLDEIVVLREPVKARGQQGLWSLTGDEARQVLAQQEAA
jgi:hypothetical protein